MSRWVRVACPPPTRGRAGSRPGSKYLRRYFLRCAPWCLGTLDMALQPRPLCSEQPRGPPGSWATQNPPGVCMSGQKPGHAGVLGSGASASVPQEVPARLWVVVLIKEPPRATGGSGRLLGVAGAVLTGWGRRTCRSASASGCVCVCVPGARAHSTADEGDASARAHNGNAEGFWRSAPLQHDHARHP